MEREQRYDPLFQFSWPVPDAGFAVVEATPPESFWDRCEGAQPGRKRRRKVKYLVQSFEPSRTGGFLYSPLFKETGLFRQFADLHPLDDQKVIQFANQYGSLFQSGELIRTDGIERPDIPRAKARSLGRIPYGAGEPVSTWEFEARLMHTLVAIYDLIQARDTAGLAGYFEWVGQGREITIKPPAHDLLQGYGSILASSLIHRDGLPTHFQPGDLLYPARWFIHEVLRQQFETYDIRILPLWRDDKRWNIQLSAVPANLISALWLQFARTIEGNRKHRKCEQRRCGKWYELSEQKRRDARFCCDACRVRDYRERRAKAAELHRRRVPLAGISKQVGCDIKTLKGWLRQ